MTSTNPALTPTLLQALEDLDPRIVPTIAAIDIDISGQGYDEAVARFRPAAGHGDDIEVSIDCIEQQIEDQLAELDASGHVGTLDVSRLGYYRTMMRDYDRPPIRYRIMTHAGSDAERAIWLAALDYTGEQLRADRDALGWTQARLAEELGYSVTMIATMERGDRKIERPRLLMLAMQALKTLHQA